MTHPDRTFSRKITDGKAAAKFCRQLLNGLPEWFGSARANAKYTRDAATMSGFIAYRGSFAIGLMLLNKASASALDIHLLAVNSSDHRTGIGKLLVHEAKAYAQQTGMGFVTVKTLGPSAGYPPYEGTRQFYRKMGFAPLMEYNEAGGRHPMLLMCQVVNG